jgi:hypothetical protein
MRTLFWTLLVINGLLIAFLIYHFATYEHTPVPVAIRTQSMYSESLKVYEGRLNELQSSATLARQELARAGKSSWPATHNRLELVDSEIRNLDAAVEHWRRAASDADLDGAYREALSAYGRAGALYLALSSDKSPESEVKHP